VSKEPLPLPCAMTASQEAVLMAISAWHPRVLWSDDEISYACARPPSTVRTSLRFLIKEKLVEKPMGQRCGARLTLDGQAVVWNIRKSREDAKDQI